MIYAEPKWVLQDMDSKVEVKLIKRTQKRVVFEMTDGEQFTVNVDKFGCDRRGYKVPNKIDSYGRKRVYLYDEKYIVEQEMLRQAKEEQELKELKERYEWFDISDSFQIRIEKKTRDMLFYDSNSCAEIEVDSTLQNELYTLLKNNLNAM